MLIILGIFFLIVWLIFFKFEWLPWSRGWKITVYTIAVAIALVVVGALQYYTPASTKGVVAAHTQQIYPLVTGDVEKVFVNESQPVKAGEKLFSIDPLPFKYAVDNWEAATLLAEIELNKAETLVKKGAASRISVDQKQAERDQAAAQLEGLRDTVSQVSLEPGHRGAIGIGEDRCAAVPELRLGDRGDRPRRINVEHVAVDHRHVGAQEELDAVHPRCLEQLQPRQRRSKGRELHHNERDHHLNG